MCVGYAMFCECGRMKGELLELGRNYKTAGKVVCADEEMVISEKWGRCENVLF